MWRYILPIGLFATLAVFLFIGLGRDKQTLPSPLIGKPAPQFSLPLLDDPSKKIGTAELAGAPYLLNVFASWCFACREEHPVLMQDAKQLGIKLVGFNYKDEPEDAKRWIAQFGDPYDVIIADHPGNVAIDFGVTGAPETFLVDAKGIIRYKYISPITPEVIATELLPRISLLKKEATQ